MPETRTNSNVGLVVDYRDSDGEMTDLLQDYWYGPIGE